MRIAYIEKSFRASSLETITQAESIIEEYGRQGFVLTLRQLYYQMVARALVPNTQRAYKRLGKLMTDARMIGMISWRAIEDRTRALQGNSHWANPASIMESAVAGYRIDKWSTQPHRVEVWIEKDALVGVISGICSQLDIDYFSCRGYTSVSAMWKAGRRLRGYIRRGQIPVILHFGDHDPSGIDMTRDILERLSLFAEAWLQVSRIALNMDQVEVYDPPPNPAKLTDSRIEGYIALYGHDSWELDALEPQVIVDLIETHVLNLREEEAWMAAVTLEEEHRQALRDAADNMAGMTEL